MSVFSTDESKTAPDPIRALMAAYADSTAKHSIRAAEHKSAVNLIGGAAKQGRDWAATAGDDDAGDFLTVLALLTDDETRPDRGMSDADTLRIISQAAGDPQKGYSVLRDALPAGFTL